MKNGQVFLTCGFCGIEFAPKRKDSIFCSRKCGRLHDTKRVDDLGLCRSCRKRPRKTTSSVCEICTRRWTMKKSEVRIAKRETNAPVSCSECGEKIEAGYQNRKYCSSTCRSRFFRRKSVSKGYCGCCGKRVPRKGYKTCDICLTKAKRKRDVESLVKTPVILECRECGEPFERSDAPGERSRKHCTDECSRKAKNRRLRKYRESKRVATPTACLECGGDITQPQIGRKMFYCCKNCRQRSHRRRKKEMDGSLLCVICNRRERDGGLDTCIHCRTKHQGTGETTCIKDRTTAWLTGHLIQWKGNKEPREHIHFTPKQLYSKGVGLRQQVRQWLCVRKGSDEDPFAML